MAVLWFGLICLIIIGACIADKSPLPNAVVWALLGLGLAFIPGVPAVRLDPHLALFLVLPPLIYSSAVQLPWPAFRANIRPISILAIGLVAATSGVVALLAHRLAGLPWPAAFALGAVVSPTDPVAANAVASKVGIPQRLVTILEGEGLVNDAVALTTLSIALTAWTGASFSIGGGLLRFLVIIVGEPLYGLLLGMVIAYIRSRITDPEAEITISLLTPFAAYLVPERLGGSGILATVAVGMYIGERSSTLVPAGTRLHALSFWKMIVFLLNGGLFLTAGMQLRRIFEHPEPGTQVIGWGLWIAASVAALRLLWCAIAGVALKLLHSPDREGSDSSFRHLAVVAWSGMRGPISLAAALSIPATVGQSHFGDFETVLAMTAVVVVATLLGQGASLPGLVKLLGISSDAKVDQDIFHRQEVLGQTEAATAALQRLSELESSNRVAPDLAARLRRIYEDRLQEASASVDGNGADGEVGAIRSELITAERSRIQDLRQQGKISDFAVQRLQRTLDLRESMLD